MTSTKSQGVVPIALPPTFREPPKGWYWRKLTDVARLESGHTPSRARPDWWGGGVSWVSLTEIRALDGHWVEQTQIKTNEQGIAHSAARILPRGTVCFSRTASVGFVTLMAKPMATSQDFANWVCGDDLDPQFLMYALICSRTELRALATGATHKTIYMPTLEAFHLCLPDKAEQQRIVASLKAQLAAVEQARQAAQAQARDIERLVSSILEAGFAATLEAPRVRLGDLSRTTSGSTPSRDRSDYWEPAVYPWVRTAEVAFESIADTAERISDRALRECSLSLLPVGAVLVAMYGQGKTRGQSAVLRVAATTNQACFAILPGERHDPQYLQFWLRHSYRRLRELSEARGGNQSNLNGEILNAFEVPLIPLPEQQRIVADLKRQLAAIEQARQAAQAQLADIYALPARLLAQAFDSIDK